MRKITSHKVNPANDKLKITVADEPGAGGANHEYIISWDKNGLIGTVVIDRLQSFQKGPFACRENALALTKLEEAKHWLFSRTLERMTRGVEGTNKV